MLIHIETRNQWSLTFSSPSHAATVPASDDALAPVFRRQHKSKVQVRDSARRSRILRQRDNPPEESRVGATERLAHLHQKSFRRGLCQFILHFSWKCSDNNVYSSSDEDDIPPPYQPAETFSNSDRVSPIELPVEPVEMYAGGISELPNDPLNRIEHFERVRGDPWTPYRQTDDRLHASGSLGTTPRMRNLPTNPSLTSDHDTPRSWPMSLESVDQKSEYEMISKDPNFLSYGRNPPHVSPRQPVYLSNTYSAHPIQMTSPRHGQVSPFYAGLAAPATGAQNVDALDMNVNTPYECSTIEHGLHVPRFNSSRHPDSVSFPRWSRPEDDHSHMNQLAEGVDQIETAHDGNGVFFNNAFAPDMQNYNPMAIHQQFAQPMSSLPGESPHTDPQTRSGRHDPGDVPQGACGVCDQIFGGKYWKGNLNRHERQKHTQNLRQTRLRCRECDKTFKRSDATRKHEWLKHHMADAKPVPRNT
ncbi:hypothetical protein ACN47E_001322 [Coniothyrium glycines]